MTATEEIKRSQIPTHLLTIYNQKVVSADDAVKIVKSGDNILCHSNCAFPTVLMEALVKRKDELRDVVIIHAL